MRIIILLILIVAAIGHFLNKDSVEEKAKEIRARAEQYLSATN